jgi:bifunctional enzyme CysN/CysC
MDTSALEREHEQREERGLLRFSTAGSVDDGKSTLVGRLLHDSKNLLDDQAEALKKASEKHAGKGAFSLALVTDGLRAEREQGITIDVAYRYFATQKRRFILADSPGHEQYTRNMATGASTADLTIVLVDASKGVLIQTKRHAFISSLLGVPRIIVAINKMDLVNYSQEVFENIKRDFLEFSTKLTIKDIRFIPVAAMLGDNIVEPSTNMPWYHGEPLLEYLENVYIGGDRNRVDFRFPVQLVIRGQDTYRGYAGQIASGSIRVGEPVVVLPSMRQSTVKSIDVYQQSDTESASTPQSVSITLADEIDVSRGDMIVRAGNIPRIQSKLEAIIVWMGETALNLSTQYVVMHTSRTTKAYVNAVRYRIDVNTLSRLPSAPLQMNEIGRLSLTTSQPLFYDTYDRNRNCGSFILIDPATHLTVAGGMLIDPQPEETDSASSSAGAQSTNLHLESGNVTREQREIKTGQRAMTIWCTGLSGSGKSTIAREVEKRLFDNNVPVYRLDGDNLRSGLNSDLRFGNRDRSENIRRAAHVARLMNEAGVTVLCSFISPFEKDRQLARTIVGEQNFLEVYLSTPLATCEERDPHGLYRKAREGEIKDFTGIDSPYEAPITPDLSIRTDRQTIEEAVALVEETLKKMSRL